MASTRPPAPTRGPADPGDALDAGPDRQEGDHLQPLLRLLPALLPVAGQPLDRPLRPQQQRARQRPAERRLHRVRLPGSRLAQHRDLAAGGRLPHDPRRKGPERLWDPPYDSGTACLRVGTPATVSRSRHGPLLLGYSSTSTDRSPARSATPGTGKPANTASATTSAARSRRPTGSPATTSPTPSRTSQRPKCGRLRRTGPSTYSSTTPLRTATSVARRGRSLRRATTTGSRAPRCRTTRAEGLDEGNVTDKPRFIREAHHLTPSERHTYLVYYQKCSSRCATSTTASGRSSGR